MACAAETPDTLDVWLSDTPTYVNRTVRRLSLRSPRELRLRVSA